MHSTFSVNAVALTPMLTDHFEFTHRGRILRGLIAWPDDRQPSAGIIQTFGHGRTSVQKNFGNDSFHRALTDAGLAVCAWDRAGCGRSEGTYDHHQSPQDSAREAATATREFARLAGLPLERIGFCGASRAGWINGYAIDELGAAGFFISVVPGGDHDNFPYLLRTNLRLEGRDEATTERLLQAYERGEQVFRSGGTYAEYLAANAEFRADSFGQIIEKYAIIPEVDYAAEQQRRRAPGADDFVADFGAVLARIRCPVLAIFGGRDSQVDWQDSRRLYEKHVRHLRVHVFPEANHALQRAPTGSLREMITGQTTGNFYAESAALQIGWLRELGFARAV